MFIHLNQCHDNNGYNEIKPMITLTKFKAKLSINHGQFTGYSESLELPTSTDTLGFFRTTFVDDLRSFLGVDTDRVRDSISLWDTFNAVLIFCRFCTQ